MYNECTYTLLHVSQVTTSGDLIHDMDSLHKKPYEIVVIGQYTGSGEEMEPARTPMQYSTEHQGTCDEPPSAKHPCLEAGLVTTCCEHESSTFSNIMRYCTAKVKPSGEQASNEHCSRSDDVAMRSCKHVGDCSSCPSSKLGDMEHIMCNKKCKPFENQLSLELCHPLVFVCVASQMHSQKPYLGGIYT